MNAGALAANPPARAFTPLGEDERKASLAATLADRPEGQTLHVFTYGASMWDAAFSPVERTRGVIMGWTRRLAVWDGSDWGTPAAPGLVLGLEPLEGSCTGYLCRLDPKTEAADLALHWQRAMATAVYEPRWLTVKTPKGNHPAIVFVTRPDHPQYAGVLSRQALAGVVARAKGAKGTNQSYLEAVLAEIDAMGLIDWELAEIEELVRGVA